MQPQLFHPAVYKVLRRRLHLLGHNDNLATDAQIDAVVKEHSEVFGAIPLQPIGVLGDGHVIRWLIDHKDLIEAIIKLLIMVVPLL